MFTSLLLQTEHQNQLPTTEITTTEHHWSTAVTQDGTISLYAYYTQQFQRPELQSREYACVEQSAVLLTLQSHTFF